MVLTARVAVVCCLCRPVYQLCKSSVGHQYIPVRPKMRFVQYEKDRKTNLGVELSQNGDIIDLSFANPQIPCHLIKFIEGGDELLAAAKKVVEEGKSIIKRCDVKILAPITGSDKVLCIGMNYKDHCEEQNCPIPTEPVIFNKFPSTIVGPTDSIPYPEETKELDWEVELVVVIGKEAKNIPEGRAMDHVFGYTVGHDVSARDWQLKRNCGQWLLGKAMDGFCPIGPAVVTKEDLNDPHNLKLSCKVNDVIKQESSTKQMVFQTPQLVSFLSRFMTLRPGDIILTGTPPGVGVFRKPPEFLKRGDIVECYIEGIGSVINTIV